MKNTRRAAAAWMTMSLAVSTVLGNTAWGDVLQETGKNRCVHVHTAECYGDADETATMSQTGELEPTECTHVCSVESGCILDTEDLENNDADAWKVGTPSNADQKDTEDGGVVSVSTPSNAEDTTINPGGTVTPAVQTKILSWSWFDPEENLLDGRLELTGITEEAQPSFTEVIEYLPQAIIAQVGEGEDWEEKNLQITNWVCTEYVQDEEGRWPLEGTYEFKAELEEGYELAEGVDALVVEVSVVGDQAAVTATPSTYLVITQGKQSNYVTWDGTNLANASGNGWVATKVDDQGNFKLKLSNATLNQIYISGGSWTIELKGNNSLDGDASPKRGLFLYGWSSATIDGDENATLEVSVPGTKDSSAIYVSSDSNLTINRGIVKATIDYAGSDAGTSAAIYVSGTLNISGGKIIAKGIGKSAIKTAGNPGGKFYMNGGTVEASGTRKVIFDNEGTFELAGGAITSISDTNGYGFAASGTSTIISGEGKLNTNILVVDKNKTMSIGENATVTTNGVIVDSNGSLENNGHLVINISFSGNGTLKNNGTISGSGTLPDNLKTEPGKIKVSNANPTTKYTGESIRVTDVTTITKPDNAGSLQYTLVKNTGSENEGNGEINSETGELTVEKIGTFRIEVKTKREGLYQEGQPIYITLTVTPGDFPKNWSLNIVAVNNPYNGKRGYPAATIKKINIPDDVKVRYEYQLARISNSDNLPGEWQSECPVVINKAESGQYVFVKVITDNYESKVFRSSNQTNINRRNFTDVKVIIDSNVATYDGRSKNPEINVVENWQGASGDKVDEAEYEKYWVDEKGKIVSELKDAGTYTVRLMGAGNNYIADLITATFTIEQYEIEPEITGNTLIKIYDGTSDITEDQGLRIILKSSEGETDLADDIYVDSVNWAYASNEAEVCELKATNITIAGENTKNYKLTRDYASIVGEIVSRDFASMTVSAAPLTYNGIEQQPKIDASVETGLENVSPDATFTYSKDGVNYQSEIPGFTEAGTYLVYVKASMANFNDETKTVAVTVQKAAAPTVSAMSESYGYKETGERQVALPGFPEDCGTIGSITAQIISDEGQILDSAAVDGMNLVLRLKGSSKNMVGKTAQVVVKVETKNYEDIQIPVIVTLTADSSDSNSNNNSGNNSGNNGSSNGNSNGGNNSGSNGGSSSSDRDRSDRDDSNASVVKVSPGQSGKVTKDSQKGYRNEEQGVITGANNQAVNDGYSHWMKDAKGWWLRYSDGTWPMGRAGAYHWEKINGRWWAFGADGYISSGWIYDTIYQGWFYMDENQGMLTGWQFINGKWYYLNPNSDGTAGIMYTKRRTPDGWYVKEDGSWDEEAGR